ncbi:DMT family transporter [Paenibacillus segetis]|uniref:Membrane protein n=1 Tax=Paenibacillus segetis TaxID=1325360 RepID=A0ABQ1YBD1_9BACL|nr:DMT family transporter [Paenibacillus segetis]GGH19761.1 membrane protein [Paenibacillus segetis]
MSAHKSALFGLLGVAVLWGFSYIISSYLITYFSPTFLSFTRMGLTWFVVLALLYRSGSLSRPTKKEWLLLLASSVFGTLIQQPLYFKGLQLSSAANASLIYAVAPLVAVFMERLFLKTPWTGGKLIGGILGVIGVTIIISFGGGKFSLSSGDVYLLIAMLGMTISMIFTPILARTMSLTSINIFGGGVGIVMMAPVATIDVLNGSLLVSSSIVIWLMLLLLAFITATSNIWWTRGVAITGPGTAAMFMNIPPFISLVAGHYLLGDAIHGAQLIGGLLILFGVYVSNRNKEQIRDFSSSNI